MADGTAAAPAKDLQKQVTQLSLLFEATRWLNSTLDLPELLELIMRIARTELKADRGSVFVIDRKSEQMLLKNTGERPDSAPTELWSIVAEGIEREEIRVPIGTGIAGRVAQTGEIINVPDAYQLEFFDSSFDKKFNYKTRSLLCMPIRHRTGEIVGVIQLLNRKIADQFTDEDVDFLTKLSGHIAMALENAQLHREMLVKQRLERDLALARNIQRSLLPEAPPMIPGFEIAVTNEMCYDVGGDYYDFLSLGPHTLLLVVADVEGKGVASALVMSNLQATLRALAMHLHSLEVLALSLNEMLCADTRRGKFMSMFLGLIDTRSNKLNYINAGHCPPLLINGDTGQARQLDKGGTVIGMFSDAVYQRGSERLKRGDVLVACTDGILEACTPAEDEFGEERLAHAVANLRTKSAAHIVDTVLQQVDTFSKGGLNIDDKVLMVVKVTADPTMETGKIAPWQP
jgi:sigma-B regulation protein RsbU (phosphoserine phosphatase)